MYKCDHSNYLIGAVIDLKIIADISKKYIDNFCFYN